MGSSGWEIAVQPVFYGLEQITILGTAKRNQPSKDKGQETKDRTKTGAPTSARSRGLKTKAIGLPPNPTPPHAPTPGRLGARASKKKEDRAKKQNS